MRNRLQGLGKIGVDLALFLVFLLLYVNTATSYFTYDAVSYALSIRNAQETDSLRPLFHPHHLIFNVLGAFFLGIFRIFDHSMQPLGALQFMNAFLGAVGVVLLYRLIRRMITDSAELDHPGKASILAAAGAAACGVSFGYWVAATDGRVNMPGLAASLVVVYLAFDVSIYPRARAAAILGFAVAAAALLHQSHGLLVVTALSAIAAARCRRGRKIRHVLWMLGGFIVVLAVPYLIAAWIRGISGLSGLMNWATIYAHSGTWWSFDVVQNVWSDIRALVHAYIANPGVSSRPFAYYVFKWGFIAGPLALAAAFALRFITDSIKDGAELAIAGAKEGASYHNSRVVADPGQALFAANSICIVWALTYAAFFTVWSPGYFIFWVPVAIAGVVLMAVNAAVFSRRTVEVSLVMVVWALAIFSVNLNHYVIPRSKPQNNNLLMFSNHVKRHTRPGDVVLLSGAGYMAEAEIYVPYFAERNVISIQQILRQHAGFNIGARDWFEKTIRRKQKEGAEVYIISEALDSKAAWTLISGRYGFTSEDLRGALSKYILVPEFKWKDQTIYKLTYVD